MMPSGFTSTSAGVIGSMRIFICSRVNAVVLRPWKERDQSTGSLVEVTGGGVGSGSCRPVVRS
jgi:hypothetical protein